MPFRFLFLLPFLFAFSLSAEVLSIGHRGNSLYAPENTVASFRSALGKADYVETDVHVTSDGKLIIMHDATVDRTTDGTGTVASKTLAQIKMLDAGSWFSTNFIGEPVPTMEEMITNVLPAGIPLVEQKDGTPAAYLAELQRINALTNILLQSFNWDFLAGVHALNPDVRLCALGSGTLNSAALTSITNAGARVVAWEKSGVTSNEVALVHNAGLQLFVWTVDGVEILNFIKLGVDGIISNDPGMVKRLQQPATNNPVYLGDDLVAYWKMDDGLTNSFATTVGDSAGTNTATLTHTDGLSHWFSTGASRFGGCLQVNATNAFVTVPHTESLDINTNAMTISLWVKLSQLPSQIPTSFSAIFDSTTDCYVVYLDKSNKELRFKITDTNGHAARPGIPESLLTTNQWLHIAATYSGSIAESSGQATIYLDGEPRDVHSGNDSNSPFGLTANVKTGQIAGIGREGPTGANYFSGYVDDLAIWKRTLSPQEIQGIFQSAQAGQSLADLIRQPTTLIEPFSAHVSSSGVLVIGFKNLGAWQHFRLLRAANLDEPFLEVSGSAPISLGNGNYQFTYPMGSNGSEYFRIEGQ